VTQGKNPSDLHGVIRGCVSWEDIQRRLRDLSEKQKGDVFEELVKAYLLLEPEYASKLKHVWLHREVPQAVRQKLKLPATDQGIDLVAETNDGEFWAVQCKYRQDTDHSLTWRDISTFTGLAFGVCRGFTFGIICSTTERITHVLKDQDRIGFCALDVWQGLDADFFARLRAQLARKPALLVPLKPRPHQRDAAKAGHHHYVIKKAKRGKLIMPCGSGKSLTAYWIAGKLDARRIVIAVPSLALIRQTLKVWLRETMANRQAVEWICVCSDESAGRIERDDVTVLRQDLGVPCLTAPDEISAWLKRKHHGLTVVFTTYQSGEALSKAARSARFHFDLGIMDEAHKTVGATDKLFSHLLHDANLPIRRRIFMTATERRYEGQSDTVLSMENPAIYGETFHLLSFKRALEYRPPILSDYKIISIAVSRDEVAELIRKNVFVKPDKGRWNKEIEADMLASLVALRKAMAKHPIRHAVSFHSSIQRAELFKIHNNAFSRAFPKCGSLETFHVSGKTPTGTRARIIGEFAQTQRALITNARCLTEGVDVPGIDCVLFADPRRSAVDIVQAVGRALRPAPGKKLGYVIVPILHDADATPDDIFESESFQEILTTLRALAANDDRIVEYFRAISQGRQRTGGGSVEFDMDERLAQRIDLAQFVREIDLKCWDRLAKLSWRPFEDARAFARKLKLKNQHAWVAFCKGELPRLGQRPADIPTNPSKVYVDKGWKGNGDWLGTGTIAARLRIFRPFREARAYARKLKLRNFTEWRAFCRGDMPKLGLIPADIPSTPWTTYAERGWENLGDWLGTGNISSHLKEFRSFREARLFTRKLDLKSAAEWSSFCKGKMPRLETLPSDIPANPAQAYGRKGWKGMGDWLGTGRTADQDKCYLPFKQARAFVRRLHLEKVDEWYEFCRSGKKPENIPAAPNNTYKDLGWIGIRDWLGTKPGFDGYLPFKEARRYVHALNLPSTAKWFEFCKGDKKPHNIPTSPRRLYKKHWKSWADWLGHGRPSPQEMHDQFWPFEKARRFARKLELKNYAEWNRYAQSTKKPPYIPASPYGVYGEAFTSMPDWLGTKIGFEGFLEYAEAEKFARTLQLQSVSEWRQYAQSGKLPLNIPRSPVTLYRGKGWKNWGEWLGTGKIADNLRKFRPFRKARAFARKLKLKSGTEWSVFCKGRMPSKGKLPEDIPACPNNTYAKKGWMGMGDWLGTGTIASRLKKYRSFREARAFARKLKLKSGSEWTAFCKGEMRHKGQLPADIPAAPPNPA
jgi:superfamily II DNA or RNA helicase